MLDGQKSLRTARPIICLVISLLFFGLTFSGAQANLAPTKKNYKKYSFDVPRGLKTQVDFWKNIYSKYTTKQAVIHDMTDLSVVYEVVDLDPKNSYSKNERILKKIKAKYKSVLKRLGRKKGAGKLTPIEKRITRMVKGKYYTASRNIRSQIGQKDRFRAGLVRSGRYMDEIQRIFRQYGLPQELTILPHVESSFQLNAYSSAGASGIWQFTRGTGRLFMKVGYEVDERSDPILSTYGAAKLLAHNFKALHSWPLALTAYNHGLNGMKRAKRLYGDNIVRIVRFFRKRSFGFASKNFYAEFLAALDVVRNQNKYFPGLTFDKPQPFVSVEFKDYVHINTAKKYFKMTRDEIAAYNPALRSPVLNGSKRIPPGFVFKAPSEKFSNLAYNYKRIPKTQRHSGQVRSKWYTIRRGDTLSGIAMRFRTSVSKLKMVNGIGRHNRIYKGQVLRLPDWGNKGYVPPPSKIRTAELRTKDVVYNVRKYDNLSRIAQKFGTTPATLAMANRITDPNTLHPGQSLTIPKSIVVAQAVKVSVAPAKVTAEKRRLVIKKHEVPKPKIKKEVKPEPVRTAAAVFRNKINTNRPGFSPVSFADGKSDERQIGIIQVDFDETLSHYAEWAGLSVKELRRVNNLPGKKKIHLNQKIKVALTGRRASYFTRKRQEFHRAVQEDFFNNYVVNKTLVRNVVKGETLWEICNEKYFIPFWLLSNYNPETDVSSLRTGDSIVIPIISSS